MIAIIVCARSFNEPPPPVDDYVPPTAQEIREAVKRGWISDSVAALRMAIAYIPKRIQDQSSDRGIGALNFRRAP